MLNQKGNYNYIKALKTICSKNQIYGKLDKKFESRQLFYEVLNFFWLIYAFSPLPPHLCIFQFPLKWSALQSIFRPGDQPSDSTCTIGVRSYGKRWHNCFPEVFECDVALLIICKRTFFFRTISIFTSVIRENKCTHIFVIWVT